MNRAIKFRAYDKEKGVMISDFLKFVEEQIYNHIGNPWRSERYIPMQFTGLKDKNGVEVYEGDLVKWSAYDIECDSADEGVSSIQFFDGAFRLSAGTKELRLSLSVGGKEGVASLLVDAIRYSDKIEVIGNIYEHKHLISEEGK